MANKAQKLRNPLRMFSQKKDKLNISEVTLALENKITNLASTAD